MPEPRTHYQVSFTSRQAVLLFVLVLVSLAGAYVLGLVTGLAGRQPPQSVAVGSPATTVTDKAPDRAVSATATPAAVESPTAAPALAAREPGSTGGLQFFEDHPEEAPKTTPATPAKKTAAPAGGYWVQVLATSSEREARSYRTRISARGYRAAVEAVRGPKGPQYRVRVGPYPSREDAVRAEETLVRKQKARTWIVSPGQ